MCLEEWHCSIQILDGTLGHQVYEIGHCHLQPGRPPSFPDPAAPAELGCTSWLSTTGRQQDLLHGGF